MWICLDELPYLQPGALVEAERIPHQGKIPPTPNPKPIQENAFVNPSRNSIRLIAT